MQIRRLSLFSMKNMVGSILLITIGLLHSYKLSAQQKIDSISYQGAAKYTHILWQPTTDSPIQINLKAIENFSGIPVEKRQENSDYYSHGKIPKEIDHLVSSLIQSSRQFKLDATKHGDYQLQFSINRYQLPYQYAPDDNIWKELKAEVDRWAVKERSSLVSLTLNITSANKTILPWSKTVITRITSCDLNASPQPLLPFASENQTLSQYLQSSPAQAFVASSNYLIIEALHYLKAKNPMAVIEKVNQNNFLIRSKGIPFNSGDLLSLYPVNNQKTSSFPIGSVEVIKTYGDQAVVYPHDFKIAHAKVGDQIEMNAISEFKQPHYLLETKNNCGNTQVLEAVGK